MNTIAKQTTVEYEAVYEIGALKGGTGRMSGLHEMVLKTSKSHFGDDINVMYIEPSLLNANPPARGSVGKYALSGHGYSWDWNICYAQ